VRGDGEDGGAAVTDLWTSSRLSATRRCLRLGHYRYGLGIGEPTSDTARFGSVGHEAIEAGLLAYTADPEERMELALARCDALGDPYERARCRASVIGYWTRYGDEPWEILAVEEQFRFLLGDVEIGGKIDGLIRKSDGSVWVVEHKFTSLDTSPGAVYWERLTIDTQVSIYVDGAAFLGHGEIAGVIYDVIDKPRHEPAMATPEDKRRFTVEKRTAGKGCRYCGGVPGGKKKEPIQGTGRAPGDLPCPMCDGSGWEVAPKHEPSRLYAGQRDTDETPDEFEARVLTAIAAAPDDFYRRAEIVRLEDELPKLRADILDTVKLARVADLFDIHPRNPDGCAKFGARSLCGFFDACARGADIHDLIRFPRGTAHPELAATTTNV
jgi:hypothetical protein